MSDPEALRELVSQLFKADVGTIGPDFPLRHPRLQGSAGRGLLAAAIRRRFGVHVPQAFSAATYGELEVAMYGAGTGALDVAAPPVSRGSNGAAGRPLNVSGGHAGLAVGVDIEMVENLPEAADFWTNDFYRAHFTSDEIAYCARQEQPRMHFAARWSAKEALAKCDVRFLTADPTTLQVSFEDGRPVFDWIRSGRAERLPHALSLTHTSLLAAAVVAVSAATAPDAATVSRVKS